MKPKVWPLVLFFFLAFPVSSFSFFYQGLPIWYPSCCPIHTHTYTHTHANSYPHSIFWSFSWGCRMKIWAVCLFSTGMMKVLSEVSFRHFICSMPSAAEGKISWSGGSCSTQLRSAANTLHWQDFGAHRAARCMCNPRSVTALVTSESSREGREKGMRRKRCFSSLWSERKTFTPLPIFSKFPHVYLYRRHRVPTWQ